MPLTVVGGALMMGGVLGDAPPYMRWSVAVIVGSGAAGAAQIGTALTRAFSTVATGGAGNGVVTTGENVSAVGVTLMGVLLPVVAVLLACGAVACVILVLPGPLVSFCGLLFLIPTTCKPCVFTLVVFGLVTAVATALDYIVPADSFPVLSSNPLLALL